MYFENQKNVFLFFMFLLIFSIFKNRYFIGGKYNYWIDLAEWLVIRGARKIIVFINKYGMSSTTSRRYLFIYLFILKH